MEDISNGRLIAFFCGIGGGMTKYIVQINETPFAAKLFEAGVTAIVCGFLGMAGKWLFDFIKNKISKKKNA
jgi:hypothetical protein